MALISFFHRFQYGYYIALDDRMIDELYSLWKEADMAYSRYYPGICLGGLRKVTNILSGYPMSRPRIELNTSRIQAWSVAYRTACLLFKYSDLKSWKIPT
jgi:hypothetical protein